MSALRLDATGLRVLGAYLIVALVFVVGMILIPGYGQMFSVRSILVLAALLAIASTGQTLVILIGGIDLSIPFVIGFANVVVAKLYGDGMDFALACAIVGALALLIGAANGWISAKLGVHPLIVTLGIGTVVQGAVLLWTKGFPSGSAPAAVGKFVSFGAKPVPWLVPAFVVLAILVVFMLGRTPFGRRLYALGSNPRAAALALIRPVRMWIVTYAISAFFAAVAGVLLLAFSGSAYADAGKDYLFQTIAAVVIGGTALVGGRGGYLGTIAGSLALVEINRLLIGFRLEPNLVQAGLGFVIIVLVSLYGREPHVRSTI
jgi:ribose transport system permease protein